MSATTTPATERELRPLAEPVRWLLAPARRSAAAAAADRFSATIPAPWSS